MKKWRDNNKEHLSRWWTTNVNYRLKAIKDQAKLKGYVWDASMTNEVCRDMMTTPCFYCEFLSTETVNGIDRMDNAKGYSKENCVGCCGTCNFMKKSLDAHTFIERCIHIAACHGEGSTFYPDAWPTTSPVSYASYRYRATKKGLEFELSEGEYMVLTCMPCWYCKRGDPENTSGIDRVDNAKGYVSGNMVPCCSECNHMRTALPVEEFMDKFVRISRRAESLTIPDMPVCLRAITRRETE